MKSFMPSLSSINAETLTVSMMVLALSNIHPLCFSAPVFLRIDENAA